ncbi:secretin N-terminal domain-containing protein [uncultured Shewanella sp.]|uniref:type II secretion system protein GspD n=1 Tax=uncultured Shewanella sp. TaxID=173975 RepID=UPI0026377032|nr:secretin N-terminal domain-containing protein [uncultured Shewanella sp.]
MRNKFSLSLLMVAMVSVTSCSTLPTEPVAVADSYLDGSDQAVEKNETLPVKAKDSTNESTIAYKNLPSLKVDRKATGKEIDLTQQFSDTEKVTIAADALPLNQFLHYVMGEVLQVSYILGSEAKADTSGITLNIQKPISKRKLFGLVDEVLTDGGYLLNFNDGIFYINKEQGGSGRNIVLGYGRDITDVPRTSVDINQIVPLHFPIKSGVNGTIQQLANVKASVDYDQNAIVLLGRRAEIIKALEFIHLIDAPMFQNRQVSIYKSQFVPTNELADNLSKVLNSDGIKVKGENVQQNAVTVLPIERISSVILFANDFDLLKRAAFWLEQLDKPSLVEEIQYFTYIPRYARASDIVESLEPLISGTSSKSNSNSDNSPKGETSAKTVGKPTGSGVASNDKVRLVVDPRSNALITQASGLEYQRLLPLIKRMDVMPKQVMLEVMIAEVTLTDEFKQGVEFAFNSGELSIGTKGAFGVEKMGGFSFGLKGADGSVVANFFASNSHVNVLSRPSVVVRDGVSASMNVGTDIPVAGETTSDPDGDRQTTTIQYRKTGVQLSVTPTVNSQGVVIMEINQSISNQATSGSTFSDSPAIFDRSIQTEVVANTGQAVILGGLISENNSFVESKVPLLGDLPWIGGAFRSNVDTVTKTELVVMVTPKIIQSSEEWDDIKASFTDQLHSLDIKDKQSNLTESEAGRELLKRTDSDIDELNDDSEPADTQGVVK